jgi:hypothetical protein
MYRQRKEIYSYPTVDKKESQMDLALPNRLIYSYIIGLISLRKRRDHQRL